MKHTQSEKLVICLKWNKLKILAWTMKTWKTRAASQGSRRGRPVQGTRSGAAIGPIFWAKNATPPHSFLGGPARPTNFSYGPTWTQNHNGLTPWFRKITSVNSLGFQKIYSRICQLHIIIFRLGIFCWIMMKNHRVLLFKFAKFSPFLKFVNTWGFLFESCQFLLFFNGKHSVRISLGKWD